MVQNKTNVKETIHNIIEELSDGETRYKRELSSEQILSQFGTTGCVNELELLELTSVHICEVHVQKQIRL